MRPDSEQAIRALELRTMLHDLRIPMMALRFIGEELQSGFGDPVAMGAQAQQEAERLLRMLAILDDGPKWPAQRAARDDGQRQITATLPDRPLVATVHADGVLRALSNLLVNASSYSQPGSHIQLTLRRLAREAVLTVSDEGIGISSDDLPRVADSHYRAANAWASGVGGSGLGLTVVKQVAELHHGSLTITSTVGEGSSFSLRLPLTIPPGAAQRPS